ncbi:hypothetical protein [uncultured Bacteroides sp.]|uniref:hypothetical protein n=1 Tax=uncultured Bacteroides sp. TaxID=162156 RepID=UPI002AAB4478|nr:hypothetical protein [uncultured Bacteroides sp.]
MDAGDIISPVLSLIAIALTIVMYFKHDKRLKRQEEKLNAYQLKKIDNEEAENKKAQIKGNIVKSGNGSRVLKIFNSGKSIARNVRIEYLGDMEGIIPRDNHFPYELLNPQDNTEIYLLLCGGASKLSIKYIWDDESKEGNEFTQILTL